MAEGARQYVVVGRSSARAIFSDKEKLRVNVRLADGCPGELLFRTRYINTESGTSVPGDLWVDGRGAAQSLTIAASALTNKARDVAAIIAVGVNASMGQIDAELAFDNTPGVAEREYFQMFMEAESLPLLPSRKVKSRETAELIDAVNLHERADRIMRAIAQYSAALDTWSLGAEIMCVAHLFMSAEALKPIAVKHQLAYTGKSATDLAREWGYRETGGMPHKDFIESEARRRIIFTDDAECHRKAKQVSDSFEHGFEDSGSLRPVAREIVLDTAAYVRRAILELLAMGEASRRALLEEPYTEPVGPARVVKYLWGRLKGGGDKLAADGEEYPVCLWTSPGPKAEKTEAGKLDINLTESITFKGAGGVTFTPERLEVWDGSTIKQARMPSVKESGNR